jgi:hypothetical protein
VTGWPPTTWRGCKIPTDKEVDVPNKLPQRNKIAFSRAAIALTTIAAFTLTSASPVLVYGQDGPPHFGHVFVIVLENEGYNTTFGPNSKAPYLSQTLTSQGVLLTQYYGTGHASNDNYMR